MKIINTTKGKISGETKNEVSSFLGVPYAKPPVGELRFTPPQQMEEWDDVKQCTEYGPCAIQADSILINNKTSEDCLYLNVWAPEKIENKKCPVFFWIHGGGFFTGCGSMNYYDGSFFAQKGIVVVTINYRLGALGFLGLKTLFDKYGTTGNWGTLDQIAALKWVNENIANFGGDPENITIAGESAGSFSVSNLIMSPLTKGMFKRAIMQSGSVLSNRISVPTTKTELEKTMSMSAEYAKSLGADDSPEGLEKLRNIDAMTLWQTGYFSSDATENCPFAFWATLDGKVLPKNPLQQLINGNYNKCDILIGYNKDEGICFIPDECPAQNIKVYFEKIFSPEDIEKIKQIYKGEDIYSIETSREIETNIYFRAAMTLMKDYFSEQGNNVYAYQFNFTPDGNYPMSFMGAHHASEIPFVFGTSEHVGVHYSETGKRLQNQMHTMWSNFVKTGNPQTSEIKWDKYSESNPKICLLDSKVQCVTENQEAIKVFKDILINSYKRG